MDIARLLLWGAGVSGLMWIALTTISPPLATIFFVWGAAIAFMYPNLRRLSDSGGRWRNVTGLGRLSIVLLIIAPAFVSCASISQLLLQSGLTVALFNSVGLTVFLLGFGSEILSLITREPAE